MTFRFIFYNKIFPLASSELGGAGLFSVEMIEAGLARKNLAVFCKLESF